MSQVLDFALAALLGFLVGLAELVSRYRDAPQQVLYIRPAWLYLALNGAASALVLALALALAHTYGWTFGASPGSLRWTQVLVAGVGAMALFRTSLFAVRAGDKDIGIGPPRSSRFSSTQPTARWTACARRRAVKALQS